MAESIIGTQCDKGRCGVRLIDLEKLEYHKNHCHDKSGNDFVCPECLKANIRFTGNWGKIVMHLWRSHNIDMELLTCDKCPEFRAFNKARLTDHLTKHQTARPFTCNECDKSFKQERHLNDHRHRFHKMKRESQMAIEMKKYQCKICDRVFKSSQIMMNHVRTVHEGYF